MVFTVLYERYFLKIYAYVFRRVGERDTTEDIVSATFEKVFLHLDTFKPGGTGTFQAWVYRIATNQVIDHVRKEKRVIITAIPDAFDQERLAQYFYDYLSDGKQNNREEVVFAVYGLASLHEPVLATVRALGELSDLIPHEKIYVGLSFAELGDLESARKIYGEVLDQTGSTLNSESIKVKIGNTPDDVIENTILLADLGASVNEKRVDMLYHYVLTTRAIGG